MSKPQLNITVISAGAGSGKTYTLTQRMVAMLEQGVRPSAIMATTFTKKAAAELQERVRARLLETGNAEAANELGSALIGTVHSIGVKLLQRFAFEAGVSPLVEIIADGDEQRLFNESLSQILTNERTDRMNLLADRLGLSKKRGTAAGQSEPYDWRKPIREITDVARANNFSKAVLDKSRRLSWETFKPLLPAVSSTTLVTLHNRVVSAIEQTVAALENNTADTTKATQDAIAALRQIENELKWRGELYWYEWAKLGKIAPGAKSRALMEDLQLVVEQHAALPEFHQDIQGFIDELFGIATDALSEYERYKQKRGLIDYTDMEALVSRLLRIDSVRETLSAELDLLLVDEFQDTSPIQLDIFLQLSQLAKHSIWVGDPKQSIYGFRGAEPALMQAIIAATGGVKPENILDKSWRSRADIVEATNAIFVKAFAQMPPEQVVLHPQFSYEKEQAFWATQPNQDPLERHDALHHWHFINQTNEKKANKDWVALCIAQQIKVMLDRGTPVFDKARKNVRPALPGDVAILCRTNDECLHLAKALNSAGLKAGISQAGLLSTPEIKLILAWLRRLVNPNDRLSAAEIHLISGKGDLETLLFQIATAAPELKWQALDLPSPGHDLQLRSAAEALDLLITELDIRRIAAGLGNAVQRLDNIEVLRRYAIEYESACTRLHTAATIGGFLLWLDHLGDQKKDQQGSGENMETVRVLTYHRSKGLEYPICVCYALEASLKEQVWGINLVQETAPDLNHILDGRWLRYWVNPYADQLNGTHLHNALQESPAFAAATRAALEEEARLLYVGITRARDHLVIPSSKNGTPWLNRVFAQGNPNATTLQPDSDETPFYGLDNRVIYARTEQIYQPSELGSISIEEKAIPFFHPPFGKRFYDNYRINPVTELPTNAPIFQLQTPIAFAKKMDDAEEQLEKALYNTACAAEGDWLEMAKRQVQLRQLDLPAHALSQQVQVAHEWLHQHLAPETLTARVPLRWTQEGRLLDLQLDWWLRLDAQTWGVVQHLPLYAHKGNFKAAAQSLLPAAAWVQMAVNDLYPGMRVRFWGISLAEGLIVECK